MGILKDLFSNKNEDGIDVPGFLKEKSKNEKVKTKREKPRIETELEKNTVESSNVNPNIGEKNQENLHYDTPSTFKGMEESEKKFLAMDDDFIKGNNDEKISYENSTYKYGAFRKVEEIKMDIILIEDSLNVKGYRDTILKGIKEPQGGDILFIFSYTDKGITIKSSLEKEPKEVLNLVFKGELDEGGQLYDTLKVIAELIALYGKENLKIDFKDYKINEINILGIGSAIDKNSKDDINLALETMEVIKNIDIVTTKYICIEEANMVNAAMLGFRSIGCINNKL